MTNIEYLARWLAKTKYKDSIAPNTAIARELKEELLLLDIIEEDHKVAVTNLLRGDLCSECNKQIDQDEVYMLHGDIYCRVCWMKAK